MNNCTHSLKFDIRNDIFFTSAQQVNLSYYEDGNSTIVYHMIEMPFGFWLNKTNVTFSLGVEAKPLQYISGQFPLKVENIVLNRPRLFIFARDCSNSTDIEAQLQPFTRGTERNAALYFGDR